MSRYEVQARRVWERERSSQNLLGSRESVYDRRVISAGGVHQSEPRRRYPVLPLTGAIPSFFRAELQDTKLAHTLKDSSLPLAPTIAPQRSGSEVRNIAMDGVSPRIEPPTSNYCCRRPGIATPHPTPAQISAPGQKDRRPAPPPRETPASSYWTLLIPPTKHLGAEHSYDATLRAETLCHSETLVLFGD